MNATAVKRTLLAHRDVLQQFAVRELRLFGSTLRGEAGGTFEITRRILAWGDAAEVVRPASLRREVATVLRVAASVYANQ
jgi:predicted nucleotidyltransferase